MGEKGYLDIKVSRAPGIRQSLYDRSQWERQVVCVALFGTVQDTDDSIRPFLQHTLV